MVVPPTHAGEPLPAVPTQVECVGHLRGKEARRNQGRPTYFGVVSPEIAHILILLPASSAGHSAPPKLDLLYKSPQEKQNA